VPVAFVERQEASSWNENVSPATRSMCAMCHGQLDDELNG
jgi:hypothetical protein